MTTSPILEVQQLSIQLKSKTLIHPCNFTLHKGEILGLVGESGSGKTLTSMAIFQLLQKEMLLSGSIRLGDVELTQASDKQMRQIRGRDMAFIMQNPMNAFSPVYTIGNQFIELIRTHLQCSKKEAIERATNALADVHLQNPNHLLSLYPFQLSGGMLQRVMIAFASCLQPKVIIADEPTTALDVYNQLQVLKHLEHIRATCDTAILLISHDLSVIAEMADRVIVMEKGHIVETATVLELFDTPKHEYTKHLLNSRLTFQHVKEEAE
ncbi:ABC transporter ATP-binding protein [Heyndrickxia sp. NPDC080065]|uniref:ABC transporter ATP-binding protein n=1 Tax=Heyndrickxia sp. NPDC080065 TaxID=3390568 RepID=UPI003CFD2728